MEVQFETFKHRVSDRQSIYLFYPFEFFFSMFLGCPETGYYGPDCSLSCPDPNCRYCHLETGVCQGCEPGYEGHHCELSNLYFYKIKYIL